MKVYVGKLIVRKTEAHSAQTNIMFFGIVIKEIQNHTAKVIEIMHSVIQKTKRV